MRWIVTRLVIVLLLAALGAFAWLTHHPEAEILTRASEWPWVGAWARGFRAAYLPPPAPEPVDEEPEIIVVDRTGRPLEMPAESILQPDQTLGARPQVWVEEGTALLSEPAPGAAEIARTEALANLRVYERQGDWFRVRYRGESGWVHLEDYREPSEPPLGSEPLPPGPLPARAPDPERLALARELLGSHATSSRVGGYQAITDRRDPRLIVFLDRVVRQLERIYSERYGVVPVGEPQGAIVLFERHRDFAAFQEREESLHGLEISGVAGAGIVAVDTDGRLDQEIAATVVHEITHLLNRRALGPALPPWLEEGLADDLGHSEVGPDGSLEPGRLGGVSERRPDRREWRGALAAAIELRRSLDGGRLRPLAELVALDWQEFRAAETDQQNYAQASFWVRQLLADPVLAPRFQGFLAGVAAGGSVEPDELSRQLGLDWPALDAAFAHWIRIRFHEP